jgi:quinol monooxygenase YgiN
MGPAYPGPKETIIVSEQVYWLLEVGILPGQLENFRTIVRELIASAKAEPGTLNYEWNLSADETVCHVYERYQNSAAVMTHGHNFRAFAERFFQSCHLNYFHLYGAASDEVKAALADLHPVYFKSMGGFSR